MTTTVGVVLISDTGKKELLLGLREWLGEPGIRFFSWCLEQHGEIAPVYTEHGIPHSVHMNEGMQVRNFLRTVPICKGWDCHQLDDNWAQLVEEAVCYKEE